MGFNGFWLGLDGFDLVVDSGFKQSGSFWGMKATTCRTAIFQRLNCWVFSFDRKLSNPWAPQKRKSKKPKDLKNSTIFWVSPQNRRLSRPQNGHPKACSMAEDSKLSSSCGKTPGFFYRSLDSTSPHRSRFFSARPEDPGCVGGVVSTQHDAPGSKVEKKGFRCIIWLYQQKEQMQKQPKLWSKATKSCWVLPSKNKNLPEKKIKTTT